MPDMHGDGVTALPERVRLSPTEYVDRRSLPQLVLWGLGAYALVILLATLAQVLAMSVGLSVIDPEPERSVGGVLDLLYFNVVTVLTIGYGDIHPVGWGRLFAVGESLAGVALFGGILSVAILKLTLPRKSSIVFSRYCYFTRDDMRFIVVFVNATKTRLVNTDMCSVLKIGGANWIVRPSYRAPYVGGSVWTLNANSLAEYVELIRETEPDLSGLAFYPGDGLKFGMNGSLGFTTFSASKSYAFADCWVIDTKSELPLETLKEPQWGDPGFESAFHYRPPAAITFLEFARQHGAQIEDSPYYIA